MLNRFLNFLVNIFLIVFLAIIVLIGLFFWQNYPKTAEMYFFKVKTYFFPVSLTKKPVTYQGFGVDLPDYKVRGLDVSQYQSRIDWQALKSMKIKGDSLRFVFIKASEGENFVDKYFAYNWIESYKAGFLRGAYHYYRPDVAPEVQALNFIDNVPKNEKMLPPVLDIEEKGEIDIEILTKNLQIWLNIIQKHYKKTPIIYSNRNFYLYFLKNKFNKYPVWIAQYQHLDEKPLENIQWIFWQHTCEAQANGITAKIDLDVFRGTFEELEKLAK